MTDQIAEVHNMLNIFKNFMTRLKDNVKLLSLLSQFPRYRLLTRFRRIWIIIMPIRSHLCRRSLSALPLSLNARHFNAYAYLHIFSIQDKCLYTTMGSSTSDLHADLGQHISRLRPPDCSVVVVLELAGLRYLHCGEE